MSILSDLAEAWPLALIVGSAGFVVAFTRDPKADEHDLSDYHEPAPTAAADDVIWNRAERSAWPLVDRKPMPPRRALRRILPPAPPGMDAGSPVWRELTVAAVVPTLTDEQVRAKADAILREIRDEALAGAR